MRLNKHYWQLELMVQKWLFRIMVQLLELFKIYLGNMTMKAEQIYEITCTILRGQWLEQRLL